MLTPRPKLTLATPAPVAPETQHRLQQLIQDRCGPCDVVMSRAVDPWSTTVTYTLTGPWRLSRSEVHTHLVAIFALLVTP